jgi:hypothetical protein
MASTIYVCPLIGAADFHANLPLPIWQNPNLSTPEANVIKLQFTAIPQ